MNRTTSLTRRLFLAGAGLALVAAPLSTAQAAKDSVVIAWQADPQTWDPMRRTNPKKGRHEDPGFVPVSWDAALNEIADRLNRIRSSGLLGDAVNVEMDLLGKYVERLLPNVRAKESKRG